MRPIIHPHGCARHACVRARYRQALTVIGNGLLTNQENFAECSEDAGVRLKLVNEISRKK
jgi:hypothetical protein